MHVAAYYNNVSVVLMLLQNGGSPDVTNMVRDSVKLFKDKVLFFPVFREFVPNDKISV